MACLRGPPTWPEVQVEAKDGTKNSSLNFLTEQIEWRPEFISFVNKQLEKESDQI